jgi:hypothetical protein
MHHLKEAALGATMPCSEAIKKALLGNTLISLHYTGISVLIATLCQNIFLAMFHSQWVPRNHRWWTTIKRGSLQYKVQYKRKVNRK